MTKIIGLTGGIGSGKTMIANYIASLGIPVYIADDEARQLMETKQVLKKIITAFGNEILDGNKLNRKKLSKIVFDNFTKLQKLNSIVHPVVKKHFREWVLKHNNVPIVVKEAAILFESGSNKYCDAVIAVVAPIEIRLQRIINRDKTDREFVLKKMQNQWNDEQRIAKSDYVVHNVTIEDTKRQIDELIMMLKNQ